MLRTLGCLSFRFKRRRRMTIEFASYGQRQWLLFGIVATYDFSVARSAQENQADMLWTDRDFRL
jgi:hypothetical protein